MYRNNRMEKMAEIEKVIFMNMCMVYAVSYTHLDVYKRQLIDSGRYYDGSRVQ